MSDAPAYLARTPAAPESDAEARRWALWFGLEFLEARPLPSQRAGVVLSGEGASLRVPGLAPVRWHPGLAPWRLVEPAADPLVAASGAGPGVRVVDATLGLGHDALVLRAAGASVLGIEASAPLALLTFRGHATRPVGPPLALRLGPAAEALGALPPAWAEAVYLDPLFPEAVAGPHPTWAPVRAVGLRGGLTLEMFRAAARVARHRVVVKLAHGGAAEAWGGLVPRVVASRRVRYAVYDLAGST